MLASRMLASRIQAAREHAIAAGVRPIPAATQRSLRGFFPDGVLRKVRVSAARPTRITLPEAALVYGRGDAMTLADIIVLRDAEAARFDMPLWARELSHVMQFERWGIDGFAARYIDDPDAVRSEAEASANRFAAWSAQA